MPPLRCFASVLTIVTYLGAAVSSQAQLEVLFQDTFDVSGTPQDDINYQINQGRQSGSIGVVPYTEPEATAPGGEFDYYTSLVLDGGETRMHFLATDTTWVSPDYNFVDGATFTIEFDVDPLFDLEPTSEDWAGVVFGATTQGAFVNASDGFGVLFRSNGAIQVFDGGTAIYSTGDEDPLLPEGEFGVRFEVTGADFSGNSPATIAMFVNDEPWAIGGETATYTRPGGFAGNYVTLLGYAAPGGFWEYTFDNLRVTAETCVNARPAELEFDTENTSLELVVKVPETFNQGTGGQVTLTVENEAVAVLEGAVDGVLTLDFVGGGPLTQAVTVQGVGPGRTRILLSNDQDACLGEPVVVLYTGALVKNPSFEKNYNDTWPHYGPVEDWDGGSGVNDTTGPFHANGVIPDRTRVAFLQGTSSMSQLLTRLEPGVQYWVQLRYNSRGCCGGEVPNLTVLFDGEELGSVSAIEADPESYFFRSYAFTPQADSGLLEIATQPLAGGDSTLVVDAITVVRRERLDSGEVVIQNPSFEASGVIPLPGLFGEQQVSGWEGTGSFGINFTGDPFADNGSTPDQDLVAFIQGIGSLSQTLLGLIAGETYELTFAYNAGTGAQPHLKVSIGDDVTLDADVSPVGGTAAYHRATASFTAASSSAVLRFEQTSEGEVAVLLDDIRVAGRAAGGIPVKLTPGSLQLSVGQTDSTVTVRVAEEHVAEASVTVTVRSSDPEVVELPSADQGVLTLSFVPDGELSQTVEVRGVRRGVAALDFDSPTGQSFDKPEVTVLVLSSFVRNPSFEDNSHTGVGYGDLASWSSEGPGNTGTNDDGGPFHDNGLIPDRSQVALLQLDKALRQEIVGLDTGKSYALQFWYNRRAWSADTTSADLRISFGGTEIGYLTAIEPAGPDTPYHFAELQFSPASGSGLLEFLPVTSGDATVLLDGITIVERTPGALLVRNPSFEASGLTPEPGLVEGDLAGWVSSGNVGVNISGAGPFADNGVNPDQDSVVFLQGQGASIGHLLTGLTTGKNYTARFAVNARLGNTPKLRITFDDFVSLEESISPVSGDNPYRTLEAVFPASAAEGTLTFEQTAVEDNTVLLDHVVITEGGTLPEPTIALSVTRDTVGNIRISWPASAGDDQVLQSTATLPVGWADDNSTVVTEGDEKVVTVAPSETARFYRLRKP